MGDLLLHSIFTQAFWVYFEQLQVWDPPDTPNATSKTKCTNSETLQGPLTPDALSGHGGVSCHLLLSAYLTLGQEQLTVHFQAFGFLSCPRPAPPELRQ